MRDSGTRTASCRAAEDASHLGSASVCRAAMEQHLAQFKEVISTLMSGDNALRGQAEEAYNTAKKTNPDVLCQCLVHLLRNDQDEQASRLRDPRISCPPALFALRCPRSEPAQQRRTVDHHTAHSRLLLAQLCAHLLPGAFDVRFVASKIGK